MSLSNRFFAINGPRSVIKSLLSSWYYFVSFVAVSSAIGYYIAYQKQDVYQSVTEILISSNGSTSSNYGYQGLAGYEAYATLSNQKRVLLSYDLLAEVVNKLNWHYSIYQEGRVKSKELYPNAPFEVLQFKRKAASVPGVARINYLSDECELIVYDDGEEYSYKYPANALYFENERVSIKLNSKRSKLYGSYSVIAKSEAQNVATIRKSLLLSDFEYTSFIKISYSDFNQQRSKDVLDTLVAAYRDYNVRAKYLLNDKTLDFIDKQINEVTRYISQGEFDLESYKAKESIIDLNSEEERYLRKLVEYDEKIREWDLQLNTIAELSDFLGSDKSASLMPPLLYLPPNESFISNMLDEIYSLEFKDEEMRRERAEGNPQFEYANNNIKSLKRELSAYLVETKKAIEKEKSFLSEEIKGFENLLRSIPKDQREIINYERKIQVNEKLYNFLLEKRAGVIIDRSTITSAAEVVEKPRSIGRIGPDRTAIRTSYALYGFVAALVFVAVRFFFFQRFKTVEDFKDWSDLPVLAGVSFFRKDLVPNNKEYPKTEVAEQYRRIRTNLQYINSDHKTILLTSMFPSEGKTHNAIHTGALKALGGRKTILLDLDLHKPSVHKKLQVPNTVGMSSLLSGTVGDYNEVKQCLFPNFDVITSGVRPPNPSELVLSKKTQELIENLKVDYDVIIIDTPPLHLITDAKELQQFADVNLLVLNTKNATRQTVIDIEEYVAAYEPQNFSLILNGIKENKLLYKYGGKKYKYAYKYGYGYGSYGYGSYGSKG